MSTLSISSENGITREFHLPKSAGLSQSVEIKCKDIEEVNCTLALCCCQQSKQFPLCDGTHKTFNKETNSSVCPVLVDMNGSKLVVGTIRKKKRLSASATDIQRDSIDESKMNETSSNQTEPTNSTATTSSPLIQVDSTNTVPSTETTPKKGNPNPYIFHFYLRFHYRTCYYKS
jgi:hypothetical protein